MGYCDDKEPDSRIAHVRATSEKAEKLVEHNVCKDCHGFGEIPVLDDAGKHIGAPKVCEKCLGVGAIL